MKKTLLMLLLAITLQSNDAVNKVYCDLAKRNYNQSQQYLKFATERGNRSDIKMKLSLAIDGIEDVIVRCELTQKQHEIAETQRNQLLAIQKKIK